MTRLALSGAALLAATLIFLFSPSFAASEPIPDRYVAPLPRLSHAQEVWKAALEWCESRGRPGAVNPVDRDGTASLGGFQFKVGTFDAYGRKYGLIDETHLAGVMDYDTQSEIVTQMILDTSITDWQWQHRQFPVCTQKLGPPPRY